MFCHATANLCVLAITNYKAGSTSPIARVWLSHDRPHCCPLPGSSRSVLAFAVLTLSSSRFWYGRRLLAWFNDAVVGNFGFWLNVRAPVPNVWRGVSRIHFFIFLRFSFLGDICVCSERSGINFRTISNPLTSSLVVSFTCVRLHLCGQFLMCTQILCRKPG